jgi:hypothetical protein
MEFESEQENRDDEDGSRQDFRFHDGSEQSLYSVILGRVDSDLLKRNLNCAHDALQTAASSSTVLLSRSHRRCLGSSGAAALPTAGGRQR